jgi:hypothetical protein
MGRQCHALEVLLRIGSLEEGVSSLDHEATWLLGHTQRISFGEVWTGDGELYVDAVLHVPCRHLKGSTDGTARCAAHGFSGPMPRAPRQRDQPRQLGRDRFMIVDRMKPALRKLAPPPVARALPVLATPESGNPCEGAPCETSDHKRGAACCRDLQVEIMCTRKQVFLEALVRHRKSPYLCKVEREGEFSIDVEMISACGFLEPGGVACTLHGRSRADGRTAKPDLCFEWPPKNQGLHPGCVFRGRKRKSRPRKNQEREEEPQQREG